MATGPSPTVVLVHGAFADASSWSGVIARLQAAGVAVVAPANPLRGIVADSAYLKSVVDQLPGPVLLVGHSYGGATISNAAKGVANVLGLVFVAAFAPDEGESVRALGGDPDAPGSPIVPVSEGFWCQDRAKFHDSFGADLPAEDAVFMADSQVPWGVDAMAWPVTDPAWRGKPTWYLIATEDRMIPSSAQRAMAQRASATTVEVAASHAVYISQPHAVAALIRRACG